MSGNSIRLGELYYFGRGYLEEEGDLANRRIFLLKLSDEWRGQYNDRFLRTNIHYH